MKKVFLPVLGLLLLAGCQKEQSTPANPATDQALTLRSDCNKEYWICHKDGGSGNYTVICIDTEGYFGDPDDPEDTGHSGHAGDHVLDADGDGHTAENPCDIGSQDDCDEDTIYNPENSCVDCAGPGSYPTVELNGKTWLAENLNIDVPGSWCYDDDPANCNTYGRLYTFAAAQAACAQLGECWRVPAKEEWQEMIRAYGNDWNGNFSYDAYDYLIDEGPSGFDALLGGSRENTTYYALDFFGIYWSSTQSDPGYAWRYIFLAPPQYVEENGGGQMTNGNSCHCVQD